MQRAFPGPITSRKGRRRLTSSRLLAQVHNGEVILIGQEVMTVKGYQFVQNVLTGGEANRRLAVITYGNPRSYCNYYGSVLFSDSNRLISLSSVSKKPVIAKNAYLSRDRHDNYKIQL